MSTFAVQVLPISKVVNHPDADKLTINTVLGYEAISAKLEDGSWRYQPGDLVVYIPEDAVVPEELLKVTGFWDETKNKGMLGGSRGNRVRPVRLRGIFSQGILLPVQAHVAGGFVLYSPVAKEERFVAEGDDVAEFLGIKKYEVEIPAHFSGKCVGERNGNTMKFDVENAKNAVVSEWVWVATEDYDGVSAGEDRERPAPDGETRSGLWIKKFNHVLTPDMTVSITSKIHGTSFAVFSDMEEVTNPNLAINGFNLYAASKGLEARGIVFENTPENIETNVYVKMLNKHAGVFQELAKAVRVHMGKPNGKIIIRSEIYGPGVQQGFDYGAKEHEYRVFAIYVDKQRISFQTTKRICEFVGAPTVPCFYYGKWDQALAEKFRDGPEPIAGKHLHEGVVVTADPVVSHPRFGDLMLKMVSPDYLLYQNKKGFAEYQ